MTCTLQFVDSIAASPTVRLDLTDAATWLIDRERTDFSPPPLRQALPSTLLEDGGPIPAAAFDRRTITLGLHLNTTTADATATQIQNLIRELNRPFNILKWHEHTTNPVFFRTFRAAPNVIRREGLATGKRKNIQVPIIAEPFAYGLLETPVSGATLNTNPALSNGNFVDIESAVVFTGAAGAYVSTPDTAVLDVIGDIDLRARVALTDWTPAADTWILSKAQASGSSRSYALMVQTSGVLALLWSVDGSALTTKVSTVATGFTDGTSHWIRATLDVDNGAAGNDVKFWTSTDGVTWTQLGSTVTTAGVTSIFAGTNPLEIGARSQGGSNQLTGRFFEGQVRSGVDGTIVTQPTARGTGVVDPVGGLPYTLNGSAVYDPGVKGDVETPALIRWPASAVVASRESLFTARRRGTPSSAPFLFQAEALTQGTDTTTQVNDANFSGTGNNYSRCTFATAAMTTRLTLSDLGTAGVNLRGRYRVYARYRKNTAGDGVSMRVVWGTSGGVSTTNDTFVTPNQAVLCMADLGEIQIPRGWDPVYEGRSGVELAVSDVFYLAFQAQRTSGTTTLDIDYLILVPADDRFGIVKWVEAGPDRWWLDADDNSAHARNSSDQVATAAAPAVRYGLPMLSPNQDNRVFMVYEVGSGMTTTLTTVTVSVSYYPRYLSVRPAST